MIYQFISADAANKTRKYRITLYLFRDENCTNCAAMPANVYIGIFNNDNKTQFPSGGSYFDIARNNQGGVPELDPPSCITNKPVLNYDVASYTFEVDLPDNNNGYTAAYQTCCRVAPLMNVYNQPGGSGGSGTGSTYNCVIPGNDQLTATGSNNSPKFAQNISIICQNRNFTLDFSATDADGDSLVYSFAPAYNGGNTTSSTNVNPQPPFYGSVPYLGGFSDQKPLGTAVTINPKTGIISGIAPPSGDYVVCVSINEYRNGKLISTHRKDFIINVAGCDFAGAELEPSYITCDGLNYTFFNLNNSSLNKTYFWDFGDGFSSTEISPTHAYADSGAYQVKLVINRNDQCGDSVYSTIKLYPGFFPDFNFTGICINKTTSFRDQTTSRYGTVNSWKWDFGNTSSTTDVSTAQHPTYIYNQLGIKNVRLIVGNSKGCIDTLIKPIEILDKPALSVKFKDTLICNGDVLQLEAIGVGNFSWTGNNMTNANTATPTVQPTTTNRYNVTLDYDGCINTDTVQVRVVNFVTLSAPADTLICETDAAQLYVNTDALRVVWTPAGTLNDANAFSPVATPGSTTTYRVTGYIGGCAPKTDDITVTVAPYPIANAGRDTLICYGTSAQLNGGMTADVFTWTSGSALSGSSTLSPVAGPLTDTADYILTVRHTGAGECPKPVSDIVRVNVLPKIHAFAGRDTAVVVTQPLQFAATGGVRYQWSPATQLSNANIANPIGVYMGNFDSIRYRVMVYDEANCVDSAFVKVSIFRIVPQVVVPTAFTPNSDGKNDTFKPIAVGIARIAYFSVYNRWGQQVFTTTTNGHGWDGRVKGKEQGTGTYAWLVKGIDYMGKPFFAKGTVTLIR